MTPPRNLGGVAAGVWLLLAACPAFATTANDVCAPTDDPCTLQKGTTLVVTPGSILDFDDRALVLPTGSGTKLDIGSGSVTIHAGSVTLNPGSSIVGSPACPLTPPFPPGGSLTINALGDIAILRDGNAKARIDVSNCFNPGGIRLDAKGSVRIEGTVTAQGTQADAGYGTIDIVATMDVTLPGEVNAAGGSFAGGGEIYVEATQGEINLSGSIDGAGGDGGGISLTAGGRIITSEAGLLSRIDARATAGGGFGGDIDLAADADVTIGSPLHAQGEASLDLGGDGGQVLIASGGILTLNAPTNLFGTVPDGIGGDADFSAALDIFQNAPIDASGKRSFGAGGIVELLAQRALLLGSITANGDCEDCSGGDIDVEGWCSVTLPVGAIIDAAGPAGTILMQSGGTTDMFGTIVSGTSVDILYHPSGTVPNLGGASITPPASVTADPTLVRCGGPGLCDRDGVVETGEECDDGNAVACDSCSNSCRIVACGNGRLDGPCEECDDGNAANCDGCRADCSRPDDVCGDGTQECGESCDPGTAVSCNVGDVCSAQCAVEACGNGVQECDEECDDGPQNGQPGSSCGPDCLRLPPTNCGNGTLELEQGEQCDEGDTIDCDGCNHVCEIERCGNNIAECLEECDDGNTSTCDGCTPGCIAEVCGNEIVDCGEECDEGDQNGQPGSTCLAGLCRIGQLCTTESTGPCIPCGNALECDPLGLCGGVGCEAGVCTPTSLMCDDANPCTTDGCDPLGGCTHTLRNGGDVPECNDGDPCTDPICNVVSGCQQAAKIEFASVECRLDDLDTLLTNDSLDEQARAGLGGLVGIAHGKVAAAETANGESKRKKVKLSLKSARKKLVRFGKKVVKLEPGHISDPDIVTLLSEKAFDATRRIDELREQLGL